MSTTEPQITLFARGVDMTMDYDVTGAPNVMGPWATYATVPSSAHVHLTLDPDGQSVSVHSVKITGYRAKKDGTAGLAPSTADFWLSLHSVQIPAWVIAIGEQAEFTLRNWVKP